MIFSREVSEPRFSQGEVLSLWNLALEIPTAEIKLFLKKAILDMHTYLSTYQTDWLQASAYDIFTVEWRSQEWDTGQQRRKKSG